MRTHSQPRFPVESITCPHCTKDLAVADGVDPRDVLWMHERRCDGDQLFPEVCVVCTECHGDLPLDGGLDPAELLWMHELECPVALESLSFAS